MGTATPLSGDIRLHQLVALSLPGGAPDWLHRLMGWLLEASPAAVEPGALPPRTERLRALAAAILEHPQSDVLRQRIVTTLAHPTIIRWLAETGIPVESTIVREVSFRFQRRFLPRAPRLDDLYDLFNRAGFRPDDAAWVEGLDADDLATWGGILGYQHERLLEAAHVAGVRAAASGLSPELLWFRSTDVLTDAPFLKLGSSIARVRAGEGNGDGTGGWEDALRECRNELDRIESEIDERGVSTEAVFRIEALEALLARVGTLMRLGTRPTARDGQRLVAGLVRATSEQRSLGSVLRTVAKRLSRKIVEYAGETGEHYTVQSRKEWRQHFNEGTAAGFLTTFTAMGKYALSALPLAPVVAGLGYWVNYSASFCLMQVNHWLLASKQPSMTAAALAATMHKGGHSDEIALIQGITRSQTAVTLANGFATMSLAVLVDLLLHRATGRHVLSAATAEHGLRAINPIASLTVIFAITTGVSLWLSSLAAGWAANWSAYRRLPDGIAHDPRVSRIIGPERARWLAGFVRRNWSGIVGYIVLGLLLGFVPVLFQKFLGIQLEVRHITLQAASVAFTYAPLADAGLLRTADVLWSFAGIAVTGLLNFSVSFYLSLRTAMRARGLEAGDRQLLWRELRAAFRADPGSFFFARG
jgi:site-specific recombinase